MPEIGIKELKAHASRVVDEVEAGASYVVTRRGRPAAVILAVEDAEDLVLANAEEFVEARRRARAAYRRGRSTRLEDLD
jgi:prevent-host-death family protein